jgi:hypothetical protein
MSIKKLIDSLYLGDRYCKGIIIDTCRSSLAIQVNMISFVNHESGVWEFNDDNGIENGFIVFDKIKSFIFEPSGLIPNDAIYSIVCNKDEIGDYWFDVEMASVDADGNSNDICLKIISGDFFIRDPKDEAKQIR